MPKKANKSDMREGGNLVVYLFCEGETELGYLQQLERIYNYTLVPVKRVSSPAVLIDSAVKWSVRNATALRKNPNLSVWVVFDYDGKEAEIQSCGKALTACPTSGCDIPRCGHVFGNCRAKDIVLKISVAFMAPCIELWGVLCTEKGKDLSRLPDDRHELQRLLHKIMPKYNHKSGAQFDVSLMTQQEDACRIARQWSATYGDFPGCMHAARYAGIYRLVEMIRSAGERSLLLRNVVSE